MVFERAFMHNGNQIKKITILININDVVMRRLIIASFLSLVKGGKKHLQIFKFEFPAEVDSLRTLESAKMFFFSLCKKKIARC